MEKRALTVNRIQEILEWYRMEGESFSADERQMLEDALKGEWTDSIAALNSEFVDYMNGLDSGAPWAEHVMDVGATIFNAYNFAREYLV